MKASRGPGGPEEVRGICRMKSGSTLFCLVFASLACSLGGFPTCRRCSGLGGGQSTWALLENAKDLQDLPARILSQVVLLVDGRTSARLSLRGGGPVWKKRWYEDDIKDEKLRAPHLLRYYLGPTGRRVYTLKRADPQGYPTLPGHPPRLDPNDDFSRQRVTLKMRHGIIDEARAEQEMKDLWIKLGHIPELAGPGAQNLTRQEIAEIRDKSWAKVQENRKKRVEVARATGTGIRPDGTVTMRPTEAARILGETPVYGTKEDGEGELSEASDESSTDDDVIDPSLGQDAFLPRSKGRANLGEQIQAALEDANWFDLHPSAIPP